MKTKLAIFIFALFFSTSIMAEAQPNVPILEVDTLCYLGKTEVGEAGGAFFLPDGNIIALWKGVPLVIDSKSGEITRRLDSLPNQNVDDPTLSNDGRYFIAYSKKGTAIWDVNTGKIVKFIPVANDYCFSPDGTKMYCTNSNSNEKPGLIRIYDMNTLEEIERFLNKDFVCADHLSISPDGQTLAVLAYTSLEIKPGEKTDYVILINLNDKNNYTVLEKLVPSVMSLEFSPDGKNLTYFYNGENSNKYINLYNFESKEKTSITQQSLEFLFGYPSLLSGHPNFIDEKNISFIFSKYTLIWDIKENRLKKIIRFLPLSITSNDDTLLLCNQRAVIGYLNKTIVSVKDNFIKNDSFLKYTNNQLEFISDKSFVGESIIYDTTGKLVANLGTQPFIIGKNIIRVNCPLQRGVYILTIKNNTSQSSYKFMVE